LSVLKIIDVSEVFFIIIINICIEIKDYYILSVGYGPIVVVTGISPTRSNKGLGSLGVKITIL